MLVPFCSTKEGFTSKVNAGRYKQQTDLYSIKLPEKHISLQADITTPAETDLLMAAASLAGSTASPIHIKCLRYRTPITDDASLKFSTAHLVTNIRSKGRT